MDNAPAGQLHSREEWELMREIFTRLYQIEGKTLQEVRDILARDYGFTANLYSPGDFDNLLPRPENMAEITVVGSLLPSPTAAIGISGYQDLGCYTELPANASARAVGQNGAYLSLNITDLTVLLCLQGCGSRLAPNSGGKYRLAAVENSRECYCGLVLSPAATTVPTEYCSSPCDGDP
ncbi:hypothetical protein IFR05_016283, partial [Cadophora sp. M221]